MGTGVRFPSARAYIPRGMLTELRVENLLLIDRAELRFAPGLNAITGETGAGKTVLAHALDLALQLLLHSLGMAFEVAQPAPEALVLLLELEHPLDPGQVHAELAGELLDPPQPLDVLGRVEARVLRRALGRHEPARLVDAQGLGMDAGQLGGDGDHVDGSVAG